MKQNSDNAPKVKSIGVIVTLLALALCCSGFHSFEECPHESVTQEVELLSARDDDDLVGSQIGVAFYRPLETVSSNRSTRSLTSVLATERSAINGLGTYLRL